jgi:hypothetical protein
LLATAYKASINIAVITDAQFRFPEKIRDVYGLLIPRQECHGVATIGIENNKNRTHQTTGHLLNIMLSHEFAMHCMPFTDDAVVALALQCAETHFMFLSRHIIDPMFTDGLWPNPAQLSEGQETCKIIGNNASNCSRISFLPETI